MLNDKEIIEIMKTGNTQKCRIFGLSKTKCFEDFQISKIRRKHA